MAHHVPFDPETERPVDMQSLARILGAPFARLEDFQPKADQRISVVFPPRKNPTPIQPPDNHLYKLPINVLYRIFAYVLPEGRSILLLPYDAVPKRTQVIVPSSLFGTSWHIRTTAHHYLLHTNTIVLLPNVHEDRIFTVFPTIANFRAWLANVHLANFNVFNLSLRDFAEYAADEGRYLKPVYQLLSLCSNLRRLELHLQAFLFFERVGPGDFRQRDQRDMVKTYQLHRVFGLLQLIELRLVFWVPPAFKELAPESLAEAVKGFGAGFAQRFHQGGMHVTVNIFIMDDKCLAVTAKGESTFQHRFT